MFSSTSLLFTDLYQLTMCQGYFDHEMHEEKAAFQMFFRKGPFNEKGALVAGLEPLLEVFLNFHFKEDEINFLSKQKAASGRPLFTDPFLSFLSQSSFCCDVDAVQEGTYLFPHEPILCISGPLWQAQLLETVILNYINYSTLIASKALRISDAAKEDEVLDFGMRRAHGPDGALMASRAAYIGGCAATSNVEAGKIYGIPVKGTHAHSWVMAFDDEEEAFKAFAKSYPDSCVLLIDTFDTMEGLEKAIRVGKDLESQGETLLGVRLDSGDLLKLSQLVRERLDASGLKSTKIVASNELDENKIRELKAKGAPIDIWGVGTRLITGQPDSALGGVYKLAAIMNADKKWTPKFKISNDPSKTSHVGRWNIDRKWDANYWMGDTCISLDQQKDRALYSIEGDVSSTEQLLNPVFRGGQLVYEVPPLEKIREHALEQNTKVRLPSFGR